MKLGDSSFQKRYIFRFRHESLNAAPIARHTAGNGGCFFAQLRQHKLDELFLDANIAYLLSRADITHIHSRRMMAS